MRLDIFDCSIFSKDYAVLLVRVLWIRLCVVDVDQRGRDQWARYVIDGINNAHRTVLPLNARDEVEVHVETK